MIINVSLREVYCETKQSHGGRGGIASQRALAMTEGRAVVMAEECVIARSVLCDEAISWREGGDCFAKDARNDGSPQD